MLNALWRFLASLFAGAAPLPSAEQSAPVPPPMVRPAPSPPISPSSPPHLPLNPLAGMPFDYLIGADNPGNGFAGRFTIVPFGIHSPLRNGESGAYVNLLDEDGEKDFGPYLKPPKGTTADKYKEGVPDPAGLGFERNLRAQLERKKRGGFRILGDIDNVDSFRLKTVLKVYDIARAEGFQFIVKNPGLGASSIDGDSDAEPREDATALVAHPGAVAIIVEKDAGDPKEMDDLRRKAGKPWMPVRFVAHGDGQEWATKVAEEAKKYSDMGVTYSSSGEYGNRIDILKPVIKGASTPIVLAKPIPKVPPPQVFISQAAINLIVAEEVTSEQHYTANLRHGEVPSSSSGLTIGIGYDIGAGVKDKAQLWADWGNYIADEMIQALEPAIGKTGAAARGVLATVRSIVDVPWDAAMGVYNSTVLPRWYGICKEYLPNFDLLSPDSRGALVSLTYNRGPSFNSAGDRYKEMRNIKAHMTAKEFEKIPHELRSMKRIWEGQGLPGLLKRRDREADLFLLGLGEMDDVPAPAVIVERDAKETQRRLMLAGLLDPPADGIVGPLTRWAMLQPTPVPLVLGDGVASALIRPMLKYGYFVARAQGCFNIVYAEGVSLVNGRLVANGNPPNRFNDLRALVQIDAKGYPQLVGSWEGTTEPSKFWTHSRMNPAGAARVKFGQYKAWTYGDYHGVPALRQAGPIAVYRDDNEDFRRDGDVLDTGDFGIHHHGGYDYSVDDLGRSSAGCLVGRTMSGHAEFMRILRSDSRYKISPTYKFMTAILDAPDVAPLVV